MKFTWLKKKANPDTIKNQEIVTSIVPSALTYEIVCNWANHTQQTPRLMTKVSDNASCYYLKMSQKIKC